MLPDVLGGVPVLRFVPSDRGTAVLLWFHGGGYRLGSARSFRIWTSHLARQSRSEVISVDYRLAPEHPFPDALLDALAAYGGLATSPNSVGRPPSRVLVGGESAGGGLAAALLVALADRGLALPAAAVLLSPWLDLRNTAASFTVNAATDQLFPKASADEAASLYLAGHPADDPLASPVLADWSVLPPVLIQASTTEALRDDAVAVAAFPNVCLELYEGSVHAWQTGFPDADGSVSALESISRFVAARTGAVTTSR
jgi:acetyl esterase/lipase